MNNNNENMIPESTIFKNELGGSKIFAEFVFTQEKKVEELNKKERERKKRKKSVIKATTSKKKKDDNNGLFNYRREEVASRSFLVKNFLPELAFDPIGKMIVIGQIGLPPHAGRYIFRASPEKDVPKGAFVVIKDCILHVVFNGKLEPIQTIQRCKLTKKALELKAKKSRVKDLFPEVSAEIAEMMIIGQIGLRPFYDEYHVEGKPEVTVSKGTYVVKKDDGLLCAVINNSLHPIVNKKNSQLEVKQSDVILGYPIIGRVGIGKHRRAYCFKKVTNKEVPRDTPLVRENKVLCAVLNNQLYPIKQKRKPKLVQNVSNQNWEKSQKQSSSSPDLVKESDSPQNISSIEPSKVTIDAEFILMNLLRFYQTQTVVRAPASSLLTNLSIFNNQNSKDDTFENQNSQGEPGIIAAKDIFK